MADQRPLCAACGLPLHRYSPNHAGSGTDLMGCINSMRPLLDAAHATLDQIGRYADAITEHIDDGDLAQAHRLAMSVGALASRHNDGGTT
jgi:hypothetical protein